jgi:membrane protein DedA with SNARE-associated domain
VESGSREPVIVAETERAPAWLPWAALLLVAATIAGALFVAPLAVHHPLWLIALNPLPRHLLLVAPRIPFPTFVLLASARGLFTCAVTFELGRCYGARGATMLLGHSTRGGSMLRGLQRLFARWSALALLIFPGIASSALAGMSGVSRARCLVISLIGLFAWACINHRLGAWLAPWSEKLLDFVRSNMLAATLLCMLGVVLYQLWVRRRTP